MMSTKFVKYSFEFTQSALKDKLLLLNGDIRGRESFIAIIIFSNGYVKIILSSFFFGHL